MSRKNKGFKTDRLDDEMARSMHNSFPRAGPTKTQQIAALQATIAAQQAKIKAAREVLLTCDAMYASYWWSQRKKAWLSTPPVGSTTTTVESFVRSDTDDSSTLDCPCGATFTWWGAANGGLLDEWRSKHKPHLSTPPAGSKDNNATTAQSAANPT